MSVIIDIVDGANGSRHIEKGWAFTRLAIITNIPLQSNTGSLFQYCLDQLIAQVGDRGSPCPDMDVPTYLEQFIPELITPGEVRIRIIYKGYPKATYELNGALSQVESNKDANDNLITVEYQYPSDYIPDRRKQGQTITQGGMISKPIPEPSFTIRFIVFAGPVPTITINGVSFNYPGTRTATEVATFLAAYVGTVNDSNYTIGLINGGPRQWMVTSVRGISRDGGVSYEMSMTFQFRAATWDMLVVFINPDDGKPPVDLVDGIGYKMVQAVPTASFPTFTFEDN